MKMFEVKAKCGHVGRKYYALKTFAILAENGKEAAEIARNIPRVKHHHKDAIIDVKEVEYDRYLKIIEANNEDPYFKCRSIQEQRNYMIDDIYPEERDDAYNEPYRSNKQVYVGKAVVRKPKKYIKNHYFEERWA